MRSNSSFTGDTLVAVADGRVAVSFNDLAIQKADVPVYCLCEDTGKIDIKVMRKPRCIGINYPIYTIVFSNKFLIHCTPNTKFRLNNGQLVQCHNLKYNDKLWLESSDKFKNEICIKDNNYIIKNQDLVKYQCDTDLECFKMDNKIYVYKFCENCNNEFVTLFANRDTPFCSDECHIEMQRKNKIRVCNINSDKYIDINSIEFNDIKNDIYSGNVDIYHNFFIYDNENKQYINVNSK